MLKAGILNGILLADNKIAQQGKQDSANIPMIRIDLNNRDHIIQFGDQAVEVSRFRSNLYTNISGVISSPSISKSKKEEMIQLYNLVDAYAMGGVIAVTEEFNIQMIICFNETELEIRTRAFSSYMFEENEKTKGDPKYKDIIRLTLKAQLEADEPSGLMNEYIEYINEQRMLQKYRNKLANVYDKYKMPDREDFFGISLERLTPVQIIELDKKLKDEKYHLDLGDPP
jgi:hypothetical protein